MNFEKYIPKEPLKIASLKNICNSLTLFLIRNHNIKGTKETIRNFASKVIKYFKRN